MANEKITSGAGLRKGRFYELNTDGIPDGGVVAGATGYRGQDATGIREVSLNFPENQRIQHVGDDQPFAQDFLAPNELPSGTMITAKMNQTLDAMLLGQEVQTEGEWEIDGLNTDNAGAEIDTCFVYWRRALLTEPQNPAFGSRRWQTHILPITKATPNGNTPTQGSADENNYALVPTGASKTPWGVELTQEDNGFLRTVRLRMTSEYPIMMEYYRGNATLTTFNTEFAPISVAKTKATLTSDGSSITVSSVDTANNTVTLNSAPANNALICIRYESDSNITP